MQEKKTSDNAITTDIEIKNLKSSQTTTASATQHQQHQQQHHHQHQQQSHQLLHQQQQQHNNIILVRGSRSENGQIILQNTHEILSLINEEDKPILVHNSRMKTTTKNSNDNSGFYQATVMKNSPLENGTLILQSTGLKRNPMNSDGSIVLQQRMNKTNGGGDGPILFQTLKRLDKTQSILVIRNPNSNTPTIATMSAVASTSTSSTSSSSSASSANLNKMHNKINTSNDSITKTLTQKHENIPLGSGEYYFFY